MIQPKDLCERLLGLGRSFKDRPDVRQFLRDRLDEALEREPRLSDWLAERLPHDFPDRLLDGQLPVHERVIREHLAAAIAPADLHTFHCRPDGLHVQIVVPGKGLRPAFAYQGVWIVDDLKLTRDRQYVHLSGANERLAGHGLIGWIVAPIVRAMLTWRYGSLLRGAMHHGVPDDLDVSLTDTGCMFDLAAVPALEPLRRSIIGDRCLLDLVAVSACQHADHCVLLQTRLPILSGFDRKEG